LRLGGTFAEACRDALRHHITLLELPPHHQQNRFDHALRHTANADLVQGVSSLSASLRAAAHSPIAAMSAMDDYGDLEDDVRPPDASQLSGKQLAEELEKRGLKVSGFADDDIRMLQRASDNGRRSYEALPVLGVGVSILTPGGWRDDPQQRRLVTQLAGFRRGVREGSCRTHACAG